MTKKELKKIIAKFSSSSERNHLLCYAFFQFLWAVLPVCPINIRALLPKMPNTMLYIGKLPSSTPNMRILLIFFSWYVVY